MLYMGSVHGVGAKSKLRFSAQILNWLPQNTWALFAHETGSTIAMANFVSIFVITECTQKRQKTSLNLSSYRGDPRYVSGKFLSMVPIAMHFHVDNARLYRQKVSIVPPPKYNLEVKGIHTVISLHDYVENWKKQTEHH